MFFFFFFPLGLETVSRLSFLFVCAAKKFRRDNVRLAMQINSDKGVAEETRHKRRPLYFAKSASLLASCSVQGFVSWFACGPGGGGGG